MCFAKKVELTVVLPGHLIDRHCSTDVNMVARRPHDVASVLKHMISISRQPTLWHNDDNEGLWRGQLVHMFCLHGNVCQKGRRQ